jgi:hypothetical protein
MLPRTNTKLRNQHTLHITPCFFNPWELYTWLLLHMFYYFTKTISMQWKLELNIIHVIAKQSLKKNIKNHKNVFNFILSVFTRVLHALNPCSCTLGSYFPYIFLHISLPHLKSIESLSKTHLTHTNQKWRERINDIVSCHHLSFFKDKLPKMIVTSPCNKAQKVKTLTTSSVTHDMSLGHKISSHHFLPLLSTMHIIVYIPKP